MTMRNVLVSGGLLIAVVGVPAIGVAQVFQDSFDAENGGVGALNYASFAKWTVSDGFVDLIGNSFFDSYPGNGLYVDLDGSNADAGKMTSTAIAVSPGTYKLEFQLGIIGGFGNDQMTVSLDTAYSEVFDVSDAGTQPNFQTISRLIPVNSAGNVNLVFDHAGGDNFGLAIDDVSLALVPEPSALVTLFGCGLLAVRRGRRTIR